MANIYTDIKMFDAESYLADNLDLVEAGLTVENVGAHYEQYGAAEGRMPNTWFDVAFYREQNADLAELADGDLLFHFAKYGAAEGRNPNPAFGDGQTIAANLFLDYALANEDLLEAFGIAANATRLTDEQQANVASHFFVYGVNEDREGGIADLATSDETKLEKALVDYTAKLDAQTAADKAQKAVEDKAVEKYALDEDDVAEALKAKVGDLETAVRNASYNDFADADDLTEESIAFAREGLERDLTIAQKQVDILKAKNPAVVNLQEKIAAYNSTAKAINETVTATKAEILKFQVNNGHWVSPENLADADEFTVKVGPTDKAPVIEFVVVKGKLVMKTSAVVEAEKALAAAETAEAKEAAKVALAEAQKDSAKAIAEFNKLKGVDALVAQVNALYGNIAIEAAATKAIEAATLKALQDAGYKVFDGEKAVAWSNVKFDEEGKLVLAKDDGKIFTVQKANKDGKPTGDDLINEPLFDKSGIQEGNLIEEGVGIEDGVNGTVTEDSAELKEGLGEIKTNADASEEAVEALTGAKDDIKAFDKAVEAYNEAKALQDELTAATKDAEAAAKAVEAAEKAFEKLGVDLIKAEDGEAAGATYNEEDEDQLADLFVYGGKELKVSEFDGDDFFYFGDKVAAFQVLADDVDLTKGKLGGDNNVLDMFAVQSGADTILYVETKAFAGSSENNANENSDFVKVTLTGVNAEDLQFEDGFLTFA